MKIAVEGFMHGDLDKVYKTIKYIENTRNIEIDLLLCCGDFEAVRNERDMDSLNVPPKYREMKSFWKYCSGEEVAPVPTIFIGGNHEASNYLWELIWHYYSTRTSERTTAVGICRRTQLDMQDCRQWVKSRMENRRAKPCEFSQTAPPHKPSDSVSNATFSSK